jgi:capsular polysaccharide biosynthesis protein
MSHGTADAPGAVGVPDRPGDRRVSARRGGHGRVTGRRWAYGGLAGFGESPAGDDLVADMTAGPTRHRSIRTALRRRAWIWCITTVLGLVVGFGLLLVVKPPGYQAAASVMLSYSSDTVIAEASVTDLSLAESRSVAEGALQRLGLRETLAGFIGSYTVTDVSDRVLQFTVTAPSSGEAVVRANVLAAEFLQFRAALVENQQQFVFAALGTQLASAPPAALPGLQAAVAKYRATSQVDTISTVDGSTVLNAAAPLKRSIKKTVYDVGGGFLGGLALGMGLIIAVTIISDRPRRRDDVARALGAPVRFSVGRIRLSRWLPGRRGLAAARRAKFLRVTDYLRSTVPPRTSGPRALAVVPVGDARVTAVSVVSLARACAQQGLKVVLADLCPGTPAARLLKARAPGVREVNVPGVPLTVAVPDRADLAPVGPLGRARPEDPEQGTDPLAVACGSADVLLTLAGLDPALGAEHLPGWATDVVVVVTAGRASSAKISAVGQMVRLAGLSLVSGVLVGADKADESLGAAPGLDDDAESVRPGPAAAQAGSR